MMPTITKISETTQEDQNQRGRLMMCQSQTSYFQSALAHPKWSCLAGGLVSGYGAKKRDNKMQLVIKTVAIN